MNYFLCFFKICIIRLCVSNQYFFSYYGYASFTLFASLDQNATVQLLLSLLAGSF